MGLLDCSEILESFDTNESQKGAEELRSEPELDIPIELTDLDVWSNYMDQDLYEMDKKIRQFLKKTRYRRQTKDGYKTTSSIIFFWIYGRKPGPKDGATCRRIHTLLKYYCTSYTGKTTFNGKAVPRVYKFSRYAATNKRPYSLKLRVEELHERQSKKRTSKA